MAAALRKRSDGTFTGYQTYGDGDHDHRWSKQPRILFLQNSQDHPTIFILKAIGVCARERGQNEFNEKYSQSSLLFQVMETRQNDNSPSPKYDSETLVSLFKQNRTPVPQEVWQQIFSYLDSECDIDSDLFTVCRVSRDWRAAALGCPSLWAALPDIVLCPSDDSDAGIAQMDTDLKIVQTYLARSSSAPISFRIAMPRPTTRRAPTEERLVRTMLQILTEECHRWRDVAMELPIHLIEIVSDFVSSTGRVPAALQRLDLKTILCDDKHGIDIRGFSVAPSLKSLHIDLRDLYQQPATTTVDLAFPWNQLREFHGRALQDSSYDTLLAAQPVRLMELSYRVDLRGLPRPGNKSPDIGPISLPNLRTFVFENIATWNYHYVPSHIESMTLPALNRLRYKDSEDQEGNQLGSPLPLILKVIRRSNCSLHSLDVSWADITSDLVDCLFEILSISPNLVELQIHHLADTDLERLVRRSSRPPAPKLRDLIINARLSDDDLIPPPPSFDVLDLIAQTRSSDFMDLDHDYDFQTITLQGYSSISLRSQFGQATNRTELGTPRNARIPSVDLESPAEIARKIREALTHVSPASMHESNAISDKTLEAMNFLEGIILDTLDTKPIMAR